jgi:hypothetical protein
MARPGKRLERPFPHDHTAPWREHHRRPESLRRVHGGSNRRADCPRRRYDVNPVAACTSPLTEYGARQPLLTRWSPVGGALRHPGPRAGPRSKGRTRSSTEGLALTVKALGLAPTGSETPSDPRPGPDRSADSSLIPRIPEMLVQPIRRRRILRGMAARSLRDE